MVVLASYSNRLCVLVLMLVLSLQDLLAIDDVDALLQRAQSLALKVEDALPRSGGGLVGYALDGRGGQHLGLGGLSMSRTAAQRLSSSSW